MSTEPLCKDSQELMVYMGCGALDRRLTVQGVCEEIDESRAHDRVLEITVLMLVR